MAWEEFSLYPIPDLPCNVSARALDSIQWSEAVEAGMMTRIDTHRHDHSRFLSAGDSREASF